MMEESSRGNIGCMIAMALSKDTSTESAAMVALARRDWKIAGGGAVESPDRALVVTSRCGESLVATAWRTASRHCPRCVYVAVPPSVLLHPPLWRSLRNRRCGRKVNRLRFDMLCRAIAAVLIV
jgi:hypothetical protein